MDDPKAFIHALLGDFEGKATQDQITQALVPDVFGPADFKRWWDSTKKALKKDPLVSVPTKKTGPYELREQAVSMADELLAEFSSARQLKQRIAALDQIVKSLDSFDDPVNQLGPVVKEAEDIARKSLRLHTSQSFEFILARDEITQAVEGLEPTEGALVLTDLIRSEDRGLTDVLEALPAAKQKRVIANLPTAFGDEWSAKALSMMLKSGVRGVTELARLLQDDGKHEDLRRELDRWIRDHSITTEILYWLCKERKGEFADLVRPSVFSAILSALERNQFTDERRGGKLHDLVLDDRDLIPDLVNDAEPGVARDLMRRLMMTPVFEELNKRSLLARIIRAHPELESMMGGETTSDRQEALIVSWVSLQKRKLEYEDIVTRKIPENTKEIGIAREYGDLRENFEFKAAKEMQRVLSRQRAELEIALGRARGTDFSNPDLSRVSIGTVVTVRNADASTERYSILGAWDSDPENGVISYQTAIGQGLLSHAVGETVELPTETGQRNVEIVGIEPYTGPLCAHVEDEEEAAV
jgi:transcription elongation GreA/GreB family factor